jgi:RNA polymerase sigma-70 factor (ECF subfamily)
VFESDGLLVALERIYRRDFAAFVRVASIMAGNVAVGHEAVQEAFARALESIGGFRGEGALEAWVWRIVLNAARRAREPINAAELSPEYRDGRLDQSGEVSLELDEWVAALPERQRLVVFLRYWADLDYRAIASVLDIEVGTVSATLSAAHRSLRKSFEEARP